LRAAQTSSQIRTGKLSIDTTNSALAVTSGVKKSPNQATTPIRPSVLRLQFLGEHHDVAARAAEEREFVDVLVGRHAA
jgi:hypothetical protein